MGGFEEKLNAILNDQDAMGQIMALAQSLGKQKPSVQAVQEEHMPEVEHGEEIEVQDALDPGSLFGELDPRMVQMGMRLLQEYNRGDDRNVALLHALRPFVKEERFAKVDRAIQIARLSRVARVLFDTMRERGGGGLV